MVFPNNDYNTSALVFKNGEYTFTHSAYGADMFRYSIDFGQTWTNYSNWEDTTTLNMSFFADSNMFWDGVHIMVQCKFSTELFSIEAELGLNRLEPSNNVC